MTKTINALSYNPQFTFIIKICTVLVDNPLSMFAYISVSKIPNIKHPNTYIFN